MRSVCIISSSTVLIWLCSTIVVNCYPYGAPCAAFNNMKPSEVFHGSGLNPLTDPPPYEFTVLDSESRPVKFYKLNSSYTVQLTSLVKKFRGFMIQARLLVDSKLTSKRIGRFIPDFNWASKGIQLQDCEEVRKYDSVTHSNNEQKQSVEVLWQPSSQEGPIQFLVTIVEEVRTYWEKWQPANGYLFLAKAENSGEKGQTEKSSFQDGIQFPSSTENSVSVVSKSTVDDGTSAKKPTTLISTFVIDFGNIDIADRKRIESSPTPIPPPTSSTSSFSFPTDERVNESNRRKILNVFEIVTNVTPQNQQPVSVGKIDPSETKTEKVPLLFTIEATTPNSVEPGTTEKAVVTESSNQVKSFTFDNIATNFINSLDTSKSTTTEKSTKFDGNFNAGTGVTLNSSDPCSFFPCYNNATCKRRPDENNFECLCTERWVGSFCDVPNQCFGNHCLNGATCVTEESNYTCQCPPNFAGPLCQHHCPDYLCAHGGKCIVGPNQFFACQCAPGWTGEHCREEIDECASNPCKFGECVNKINGFQCRCLSSIMGARCHRPCQDIYHSCPLWREEETCDTFRNRTKFFDLNCAASCGLCIANQTVEDGNSPFPPVLEPLLFLLGKWTFNSSTGQRFPTDINALFSAYTIDMEFFPAAANMFGPSSLKYKTRASSGRFFNEAEVTQGFLTAVPKGDTLRVALHSTGNDGVTILEEGFLEDKKVSLKTTDFFAMARVNTDKLSSNAGRSFEISEPYLKETVERVTADNVRFVFTNYYRLVQSYAPF